MGIGPRQPKIMIVSRLPLSDKRRDELSEYLKQAGINPAQVFFTATNRCKVWGVEPNKADIKACKIYLEQEIKIIQPQVIVPLGNEALLATTGRSGIMKYRGKTFHVGGVKVIPTISPSMVQRNPGQLAGFIADLAYVRRVTDDTDAAGGLPGAIRSVMTGAGFQALTERLRAAEGVAFDIETNSFDEFRPDSMIISISMTCWDKSDTTPRDVWVLPLAHPDSPFLSHWQEVIRWLWEDGLRHVKKVVAHNGKFDARWMHHFGAPIQLTFDTMLAAHLLDENRPKALESLARTLLGAAPWKIDNMALMNEPLKKVIKYNALDTWHTAGIYFKLKKQLEEQPRLKLLFVRMIMPLSNVFVPIEREGIWTDRVALDTNAEIARRTLQDIDDQLTSLVPSGHGFKEINFNPSNFARWLLFEHLGYPVLARGKDKEDGSPGQPSMAESIMLKLQAANPDDQVLKLMIERTKWQKYSSAFFSAYQEQIDDHDRIHTTFKITGTVTGRLSSGKNDSDKVTGRIQNRGVNLQQVPRDNFVRGIFGAPPASVFIECDYSQIELRVAAYLARERTMIHLYNTGQDIHMTMAMRMTGKPASEVSKEERKKAKAVNFGFLYGMGWAKFIETAWSNYGVVVSESEAQAFRRAFFEQFPDLNAWHNRQRSLAAKYRRVESPLGRVRHLPDIDSPNEGVRREAERQAINSPVQSFASDMCCLSLVTLQKLFTARELRAHSVGTVHDAINFEVPLEEVNVVVPLIRRVMEGLPLERWFGVVLDIPIIADVKIGTRWGAAIEVPGDISNDSARLDTWVREHAREIGIE